MSSNLFRSLQIAIPFASALLMAPASAVVVADLHEVTVAVTDQSPEQRAKAFRAALAQVVVRLTGNAKAPDAADLAPLMKAPQRFVGEFAYVDAPPVATAGAPPVVAAPNAVPPKLTMLRVRFEGLAIERALRQAGRTVWGPERPLTLVWLALDDGPERDLVGAEDADAFVAAAAVRGLPLSWPPLDGDDRALLDIPALTALDDARIIEASARHPSDAVLAGRAWRAGKLWQGKFELRSGDDATTFEVSGTTLDQLAAATLDRVAADGIARYGAANAELPNVIDVALEGVTDVAGYARAFAYLQGLSPVRRVDLLGSAKDVLSLRVTFRGEIATLEHIIALDHTLQRSSEAPSGGGLRYRLASSQAPVDAPVRAPAPTKP